MSHFAKRHYEAIADLMQRTHPGEQFNNGDDCEGTYTALDQWNYTRDMLMTLFKQDNNRFDVCRFEHACKPGSNVRAKTAHLKVA